MSKPRLFVGSATESLEVAYAVEEELEHDAEVTVWTQGLFELSKTVVEGLLAELKTADFGLFIFTPDDVVKIRGTEQSAVRDNVLFELGLFVGRLGRERSFILLPKGTRNFHLPSDLAGLLPAIYEPNRSDGNLRAAVGPACNKIRKAIKQAGPPFEHRVIQTAQEKRACTSRIVTEANEILYVTGSRSHDTKYIKLIEARVAEHPELIHYRVLFGPPHYGLLKSHLRRLIEIRAGRDTELDYKTVFLGLYKNTLKQYETFILGNEREAIVLLPSFSGVGESDSCLLLTSPASVEAMKRFVKQLYTASDSLDTLEAINGLEVLKPG